jgi:hypothetical protein
MSDNPRPKLKTRQVAYEPGVDPLLVMAVERVSQQLGSRLNPNNPCHLGIAIEYMAADYLAGLAGCHLDAGLNRFPGNWR